MTETCDDDESPLITHVETTVAGVTDSDRSAPIHEALAQRTLLPSEHFLDAGYVDADLLVTSQKELGVEVVSPVRASFQLASTSASRVRCGSLSGGLASTSGVCPQGHTNTCWTPQKDAWANPVISVKFSRTDCRLCSARCLCTKAAEAPRHLTLRAQADHQMLQCIRELQTTPEWK